jgi:transposase
MVANTLQALAINAGVSLRAQLLTSGGRVQLQGLRLSVIAQQQRDELLSLADELSGRVVTVERWLKEQGKSDERVRRLQTHPGVGLLTSLCLVHTLGELTRFSSTRKVAAYVGFDPVEHSSQRNGKCTAGSVKPAHACCVICWWRPAKPPVSMTSS